MSILIKYLTLEYINVIFGILYVFYLTLAKPVAWVWGIIFCLIACYSSAIGGLYLLALLNVIFVILGVLGLYNFKKNSVKNQSVKIIELSIKQHIIYIFYAFLFCIIIYFLQKYILIFINKYFLYNISNAFQLPFLEIPIFALSIIATYLQTKAVRSSWAYYIIINILNIVIYYYIDLKSYSIVYSIFGLLSIKGLFNWSKLYNAK